MAAKDHLRRIRLPMAEKMAVGRAKKMASKPYVCKKEGNSIHSLVLRLESLAELPQYMVAQSIMTRINDSVTTANIGTSTS